LLATYCEIGHCEITGAQVQNRTVDYALPWRRYAT
jgi:hypothetical protein